MESWDQALTTLFKAAAPQQIDLAEEHGFWEALDKWAKPITAAGGVVFNGSQELLVIERLGKLDLPKGKMESEETPEICAVREVEEECALSGLLLEQPLPNTYHMYPHKGAWALKTTYWYQMTVEGEPQLQPQVEEGITAVYWAGPELLRKKLNELGTYRSLLPLFAHYLERVKA